MEICHAELHWRLSERLTALGLWHYGRGSSESVPRTSSLQSTSSTPSSLVALQVYLPPSNRLGLRIFRVNTPWWFCIRNLGSSPMIMLFFIQMIFGWGTGCWRKMQNWRDGWEERGGGGRAWTERGMSGRVGEQREEGRGEIRSTFRLDKSLLIRREREKKVFKDLFAPPLVLSSDIKIYPCCKGIKILSDCSTLTVWHSKLVRSLWKNTKHKISGAPLQQSCISKV